MNALSFSPALRPSLPKSVEVLVVGGGINGAGIARDLAGRGVSVLLCEKDDLASHTSSASTKLIHGGLRYLEYYEFGLVRKALQERELLMRSAPHIMWPLRFVMPHDPSMRPAWLIRLGLFFYDHLAKREVLLGSRGVDFKREPSGVPLRDEFRKGFAYSDGWVDDARLVVLNARDAARRGAVVATRTTCVDLKPLDSSHWQARLQTADGHHDVQARVVINAAGPWAERFLKREAGSSSSKSLRLVRGSHIVVPRLFEHDDAYIFQSPDKRIIFAIPYEQDFTLVGTTDVTHNQGLDQVAASEAEIVYLCEQVSRYFKAPVRPDQVVHTYSGVRPLLDDASGDPSAVTRDYQLELLQHPLPILNVWGGKITTFRRLAEEAADLVSPLLGVTEKSWTAEANLPGGDLDRCIQNASGHPVKDFELFVQWLESRYTKVTPAVLRRLARAYGSEAADILGDPSAQLKWVTDGVPETELRHAVTHEWAYNAEDFLWRRSKLGLHLDAAGKAAIAAWFDRQFGDRFKPWAADASEPKQSQAAAA